jgi:hypothetical protein
MCLNYLKNAHRKQRKNAQESDYTTLQVSKRSPLQPIIKSELKNRVKTAEKQIPAKTFKIPAEIHITRKNPPKIQTLIFPSTQNFLYHFSLTSFNYYYPV